MRLDTDDKCRSAQRSIRFMNVIFLLQTVRLNWKNMEKHGKTKTHKNGGFFLMHEKVKVSKQERLSSLNARTHTRLDIIINFSVLLPKNADHIKKMDRDFVKLFMNNVNTQYTANRL